jgi:hypothetical protein
VESTEFAKLRDHELEHLIAEFGRVANSLERQNKLSRRLLLGVIFGVGTALGASIIASLIIFVLSQFMRVVGLETVINSRSPLEQVIEQQVQQ